MIRQPAIVLRPQAAAWVADSAATAVWIANSLAASAEMSYGATISDRMYMNLKWLWRSMDLGDP